MCNGAVVAAGAGARCPYACALTLLRDRRLRRDAMGSVHAMLLKQLINEELKDNVTKLQLTGGRQQQQLRDAFNTAVSSVLGSAITRDIRTNVDIIVGWSLVRCHPSEPMCA